MAGSSDSHEDALTVGPTRGLYDKTCGENRTKKQPLERRSRRRPSTLCCMGLLDDAIREHLELKRRRGADPTEIERAEREALGPVRRSPEVPAEELSGNPLEEGATAPEPSEALPSEYEHPREDWEAPYDDVGLHDEDTLDHEDLMSYESDVGSSATEDLPAAERGTGGSLDLADQAASSQTEPSIPRRPADPRPPTSDQEQETEEYELEPGIEDEGDVLESTPEFLQDAPDHDRLWFEQRPPRDFDFDG
jgi:hypothetical protein